MRRNPILIAAAIILAPCVMAQTNQSLQGLRRPPDRLKVAITVDGTDTIFVRGKELWVVHESFELPSNVKINGKKWTCQWSKNTSDRYTEVDPPFSPRAEAAIEVKKTKGRGEVQLVQKPAAENNFTAGIRIADVANASDKYEFTLSWE